MKSCCQYIQELDDYSKSSVEKGNVFLPCMFGFND